MAGNLPSYHPTLEEQLSGKHIQSHVINQDQIKKIVENLRKQISKSIKEMKDLSKSLISAETSHHAQFVVPLSSISPQEVDVSLAITPKKKGKKMTTKVVGEFSVSYEVPQICIQNNIDLDNLPLDDEDTSNTSKGRQFSFMQRLQSWNLEQRERTNGMRDVYYHHIISGSSFRSKKEVVDFLIYERHPPQPNNKKDKKLEVAEGASAATNESSDKKKQKCDEETDKLAIEREKEGACAATGELSGKKKQKHDEDIDDQLAMDRENVFKFLSESYENLMNYDFSESDDD